MFLRRTLRALSVLLLQSFYIFRNNGYLYVAFTENESDAWDIFTQVLLAIKEQVIQFPDIRVQRLVICL